jgi:hypothetical protein
MWPRNQLLRADLSKGAKSVVPLADRAIGNLQQWLIGTYHGVSRDQLQVYLDEFVFRHNRRRLPMAAFQTLLGLGSGLVFSLGQCDKKNHGWRESLPLKRTLPGIDLVTGLHPPGKSVPNEKRIPLSDASRVVYEDWPV